jgi:DNA-binding NarL/FixJ family response regulator
MTQAAGPARVRIVLADDHNLFREGIREMLSTHPGFVVVGEGGSGDDALLLVTQHRPAVLLLDVEMPGPGALEVIRRVRRISPTTQIAVITMHDDAEIVRALLDGGAAAYLIKTILRDELIAAVSALSRSANGVLLSVSRDTIERLDGRSAQSNRVLLTERELDVLRLAAQAFSNAQIATRLHVTEATVKRHLTNVYAKLGAVSRVDAIQKATTARLLPAPGVHDPGIGTSRF